LQLVKFLNHLRRVQHNSAGNDTGHPRRQHTAGQQRKLVDFVARYDRMAGVGSALIANDHIVLGRQQIDNFALRLVAPLQPDNTSSWHEYTPPMFSWFFTILPAGHCSGEAARG